MVGAKDFLERVSEFYLEFTLYHEMPEDIRFAANCFRWDIRQLYSYTMHGSLGVSLSPTTRLCSKSMPRYLARYTWFNLFMLSCAIASFILSLQSIRKRLLLLGQIRGMDTQTFGQMWAHLSTSDRMRFVNLWTIGSFISNILEIFACITFFFVSNVSMDVYFRSVGFGCFFAWVNVIRYLDWSPNSYAIVTTLKRSFATLWRYVFGILPIFMAFVFLAMTLFWKSGNYNDAPQAMITSFALLNGDNIYGYFSANVNVNFIGGYVYMFVFLVLFICAIHNIFISIIGQGFDSLKSDPVQRNGEQKESAISRIPSQEESKKALSSTK